MLGQLVAYPYRRRPAAARRTAREGEARRPGRFSAPSWYVNLSMPEQFQCPKDDCGFVTRDEEYDEVAEQARRHLESEHDESPDEDEVEEHVASVSGA